MPSKRTGWFFGPGVGLFFTMPAQRMNRFLLFYMSPTRFEETLYSYLAVDQFVRITPLMLRAKLTGKYTPIIRSRKSVVQYFRETVAGEMVHIFSLLFLTGIAVFAFSIRKPIWATSFLLFNTLVNLYPIFLMRYNRIRIGKALKRDVATLLQEVAR